MTVQIEEISSVKKKLSFEVGAEQVDREIDKAYEKIGKSAKIKGFRPGKIPRHMLEKYYAPQMEEQVLGRLINDSYFKAIVEHRIAAVADPEIVESSPLERGKPFTYSAQVEVKPQVEVKDYTGLKLEKEKFDFDPQVVEDRLREMRESRSQLEVASREEARKGDFVQISFEGFVGGTPFEGGKADDYLLELGSGSFIPGFEDQVEGMKKGEEKDVNVTFPENYGNKELAGQPAVFRVVLKEIKEKVVPQADDEFAKEVGLESLAELRQKIEENYRAQETGRIEEELRERLVDALVTRNPVEVPDSMVESQLDYMLQNVRNRFRHQGMTLEMLGMNDESFRATYRGTAIRQLQGGLLLEAVGRQEDIKVEGAEIDQKMEEIATQSGTTVDAVRQYYSGEEARRNLISRLVEEKTVRFLLEKSKVKEVNKDALAGDKNKKEEKEG